VFSVLDIMTKKKQIPKTADRRRAGARPGQAAGGSPAQASKPAARLPTRAAAAAAVSGFLAANAVAVRFCVLFPVLLLLCWVALQRAEVNHYLALPFATLIATLAGALLRLLHAGATLSGAVIAGPGVSLIVVERCSTLFEMGIFLAALIAYPARPRAKLWGALAGVGCIFLLGITRVVALYYIGRYAPDFFELAHIHVGQSLLILLIVLLWVYWVERFARAPVADG
jgi:exosortase/archaeosortase family protein